MLAHTYHTCTPHTHTYTTPHTHHAHTHHTHPHIHTHTHTRQWRIYIVKFWMRAPPWGSKFFQFHAVFGKIWQNRVWVPPLGSWCPLLGEILDPPLHVHTHTHTGSHLADRPVCCSARPYWWVSRFDPLRTPGSGSPAPGTSSSASPKETNTQSFRIVNTESANRRILNNLDKIQQHNYRKTFELICQPLTCLLII